MTLFDYVYTSANHINIIRILPSMHQEGEQEGMPERAPLAFAAIQKHYGLSSEAVALAQPWHVLSSLRWQCPSRPKTQLLFCSSSVDFNPFLDQNVKLTTGESNSKAEMYVHKESRNRNAGREDVCP